VRLKYLLTCFLVAMAPVVLFWGCAKGNSPVSLASTSSASITVPLTDSHGKDFSATQVNVLYYIGGAGAPVTGTAGTASASTGNSFSFNVGLPSGSSYGYVAVQINAVSNNQVIAVGATTLTGGTVPVTLGPVNKPVYEVNPLGVGQAFGFESDTTVSEGMTVAATTPGLDVECNNSSDGTGFELDNALLTINSIAYMGNGNFVDYLQLPATTAFATSSSLAKAQVVKTGSAALAPGDVYCAKLSGTGYAWLQITGVSAAGPAFVYRVNTTLPYCGYEQTTADAAAIAAGSPTPTATAITAAVTIAGSVAISGSPYDVAVFGPTNGAAATMFVSNSIITGTVGVYNVATLTTPALLSTITGLNTPVGLAVDPNGPYLYVANSGASFINQYQISGTPTLNGPGPVGGGAEVSGTDNSTQAANGALADPRYVALDSTGNLFITDTGTVNVSDVMEFLSPVLLTATTNVNYWKGSLNSTGGANSIGQVTTAGTTVIVANSALNRIDFYSETETTGSSVSPLYSLSSDNNLSGAVTFSSPQGVAYSIATGLLYISDTGHDRIVEMSLTGTFSRILSTGLGLNGPTGIKVDNAIPPNIFVADTGNSRVLILQ
jgi:hypothetical protein